MIDFKGHHFEKNLCVLVSSLLNQLLKPGENDGEARRRG